jgi:curved DNA-binding protein CbpA
MTPEAAAAILGVDISASKQEVDAAWRRRARMTHPDRFAGASRADLEAATAEFIRVGLAQEALHASRTRGKTQTSQPTNPNFSGARSAPKPAASPEMSFSEFVSAYEEASWGATPSQGRAQSPPPRRPPPSANTTNQSKKPAGTSATGSSSSGAPLKDARPAVKRDVPDKAFNIAWPAVVAVSAVGLIALIAVYGSVWQNPEAAMEPASEFPVGAVGQSSLVGEDILDFLSIQWRDLRADEMNGVCADGDCYVIELARSEGLDCEEARLKIGFSSTENGEIFAATAQWVSLTDEPQALRVMLPEGNSGPWPIISSATCSG